MSHIHHTSHVSPHMDHSTHHMSPHHMSPHHMAPVHHHMIPQEDTPHYITISFVVFSILLGLIAIVLGGLAVSGNINFFKVEATGNISSDSDITAKGVISTDSGFEVRSSVAGTNVDTNAFNVAKTGDTTVGGTLKVTEKADFLGDVNVNNKFVVTGTTGDTTIAGSLGVRSFKLSGTSVNAPAAELNTYTLTVLLTDISSVGSSFVVAPKTGTLTKVSSVIDGTIQGDVVITVNINGGSAISNTLKISSSGSTGGITDTMTPSDNKEVVAGDYIKLTSSGTTASSSSTFITSAVFTLEITY